jgi:serine/threonine protein kinase
MQETKLHFFYDKRLDDTKLLFLAMVNQFQFLVKFTPRYSENCHRYLERRGRAPKLLNCCQFRGGWKAVFMEISRYKPLYGMKLTDEENNKVREKVMKVVIDLHEGGFVHGDIRDTNILVDPDSLTNNSDGVNVQLIDFVPAWSE